MSYKENHRFLLKLLVLVFAVFVLTNCDSNSDAGGGGTATTDPTADVATNVGPVEDLVATDVLTKSNAILDAFDDYLEELDGAEDDPGLLLTKSLVDEEDEAQILALDFAEDIDCDTAGTKNIIGSGTFTLDGNGITGTLIGTFTIQYSSCEDIRALTTTNGACSITPSVTGEVAVTVNTTFTIINSDTNPYSAEDYTTITAANTVALDITVGTTDADQLYSFTYTLSTSLSSDNLNGLVTYAGSTYDMEEIETYISGTATTAICAGL